MFWVTGAGGCTLHRTGRSSKTISPRTNITCTDTGALGPHLATSGFYHLTDTKMMKITLVTCARYKVSFSFLSWYFLRPLYCQLGKSTTSATRLCQLVTGGHNGGAGQTLARCHDMSRGGVTRLTRVWQECDAVMYLHFCHPCRRSCVM